MRRILVLALSLAMAAPVFAARRRSTHPPAAPATSEYLRAAIETAAWLSSIERPAPPDGIRWPKSMVDTNRFSTGMADGAAGIGAFFLRLHEVTRDPVYLDKAKGAANYVANEYQAGRFSSFEWLGGSAGGGHFLVLMYRATNEARYLNAARAVGNYLVTSALREGDGIYWKHGAAVQNTYTGIAHGAAGAGLFLCVLYEIDPNPTWLDTAKGALKWMKTHTLPTSDNGIVFKRLIVDTATYPGWCGGSSGILFFIDKLAAVSGDASIRETFAATANGLNATAVSKPNDTVAWWFYGTNTGHGNVYCHGTSSSIGALAEAHRVFGDPRYLETARRGAKRLESVAQPDHGGLTWPQFEGMNYNLTGLLIGAASVGHSYLRVYNVGRDASHLDRARDAAAYLLAIADHPQPGQTRWINYTATPFADDDPQTYETGWYVGAAGIGLFMLELHDAQRGMALTTELSPINP